MAHKRHLAAWVGGAFAVMLVVIIVAVLALTRTQLGVQRVGRYIVGSVAAGLNGKLRVGRITSPGGLLGGVTLHDVSIHDPRDRPFLDADSVILSYDWRTLVSGRIVFDRLRLYHPRIVLETLPGDTAWNFETVLAGPPSPQPAKPGPSRLILIGGLRIYDGTATVRFPWAPDSAGTTQPADTARLILTAVPGGTAREMRFEDLQASLPRVLVSSPDEPGRVFEVADLATRGYVWTTPFQLERLRGTLTLRDSLVSFDFDPIQLPDSRFSAVGRVIMQPEVRFDVQLRSDHVDLADMGWVSPDMPDSGGGRLDLRMQTQPGGGTLWYASNVLFRAAGTRISGALGIVTGDSAYFTRVDLQARPLNMEVLDRLIPGNIPMQGLRVGSVRVTDAGG